MEDAGPGFPTSPPLESAENSAALNLQKNFVATQRQSLPELAEVEAACHQLQKWTADTPIERFEIYDPRVLQTGTLDTGQPIKRVQRRGKYICAELATQTWILHLRMTGKLTREPTGRVRLTLVLVDSPPVHLQDNRCLATCWVLPRGDVPAFFAERALGPEPWPGPRSGRWWASRFETARGNIKTALLNQKRVAGLGNIAASESLYRARLSPEKNVPDLVEEDWEALALAVHEHLEHALEDASKGELVYLSEAPRQAHNPFLVYGREGAPCPRCRAAAIARIVHSARATFYCPSCQI